MFQSTAPFRHPKSLDKLYAWLIRINGAFSGASFAILASLVNVIFLSDTTTSIILQVLKEANSTVYIWCLLSISKKFLYSWLYYNFYHLLPLPSPSLPFCLILISSDLHHCNQNMNLAKWGKKVMRHWTDRLRVWCLFVCLSAFLFGGQGKEFPLLAQSVRTHFHPSKSCSHDQILGSRLRCSLERLRVEVILLCAVRGEVSRRAWDTAGGEALIPKPLEPGSQPGGWNSVHCLTLSTTGLSLMEGGVWEIFLIYKKRTFSLCCHFFYVRC